MNESLISVIVPVYNTEKYLERCINSILHQTYKNIELILVDDGSTDNSSTICDEYAKQDYRVKVIHKKNGGLSSARNAGLDIAIGDYIGFIDSDDYISEKMYESLYKAIEGKNNSISNVMFVRVFSDGYIASSTVPHNKSEIILKEKYIEELLLHKGDASVCSKLFPRKLLIGKKFKEGKLNEDLLFMFSILKEIKNINFVGEIGYYYFVRECSITNTYGKSFCDMVDNSLEIKDVIYNEYPVFKKQADRFAIVQHIEYLLHVPDDLANRKNELYVKALRYMRKHAIKCLFNKYLTTKYKLIMFVIVVSPTMVRRLRKTKRRSR